VKLESLVSDNDEAKASQDPAANPVSGLARINRRVFSECRR
jgi:hypothetical protein